MTFHVELAIGKKCCLKTLNKMHNKEMQFSIFSILKFCLPCSSYVQHLNKNHVEQKVNNKIY